MPVEEMAAPAVGLTEAAAFARVETGAEEAVLAGLVRSASALCEAFVGQVLVMRGFSEIVAASGEWQRLGPTPVRSIDTVEVVGVDGTAVAMAPGSYAVDIDARGDGWVRVTDPGASGRLKVRGQAGLASNANGVPEPLRQGILRLVAHLFAHRDGEGGEPPAAVTALWRSYRRMRLL